MQWSPQQEAALARVAEWRRSRQSPWLTLGGYAGTGKTTLVKEIASGVVGDVYVASYTGKAAHVLRSKGVPGAVTIHRLIYTPHDKCDARLVSLRRRREQLRAQIPVDAESLRSLEAEIVREQENLRRPEFTLNYESPIRGSSLVIVDEYSMVGRRVGEDLLSFGVPVLAIGDPAQLPPVGGDCFFRGRPDVLLTEIHRHAADNPIVRMSMLVREGKPLPPGDYGESRVVFRSRMAPGELDQKMLDADQVLVGLNATRRRVNREVRVLRARGDCGIPVRGDKLVCLRNSHDEGLLNGQTWEVVRVSGGSVLRLQIENEDGERVTCLAHRAHFEGDGDELDPWTRRQANEFDFGYALTVHKAQGSQWDSVLLYDEWRRDDRPRWLYTALTRAAKKITVVR